MTCLFARSLIWAVTGCSNSSEPHRRFDEMRWSRALLVSACYGTVADSSVTGVNLFDPSSAPRVIKTWDDRLIEEGVDSGVDDEVG